MLVWYDVIFVFGVEGLVLDWNIDFLWCKVRASIEFLEYDRELVVSQEKRRTGQNERSLQMGVRGES